MEKINKENFKYLLNEAKHSQYKAYEKALKSGEAKDEKLYLDFYEKKLHFHYLIMLSKDMSIENEIEPIFNDDVSQRLYDKSIMHLLLNNPKEKDFEKILDKNPHIKIYYDFLDCSLNKIHDLQNDFFKFFSTHKTHLDLSNERIDKRINLIDSTYPRPKLILDKLKKMHENNELSFEHLHFANKEIQLRFDNNYISKTNKLEAEVLENLDLFKESEILTINVSATNNKVEEFIKKINFSDEKLSELYNYINPVKPNIFNRYKQKNNFEKITNS